MFDMVPSRLQPLKTTWRWSRSIDVKCQMLQGDFGPTDSQMVSYQLFSTSDDRSTEKPVAKI